MNRVLLWYRTATTRLRGGQIVVSVSTICYMFDNSMCTVNGRWRVFFHMENGRWRVFNWALWFQVYGLL